MNIPKPGGHGWLPDEDKKRMLVEGRIHHRLCNSHKSWLCQDPADGGSSLCHTCHGSHQIPASNLPMVDKPKEKKQKILV
jgi:hypothetical protein